MLPSGSAGETGMEMVAAMIYEDGSIDSFEFEIGCWSETTEILELDFCIQYFRLRKSFLFPEKESLINFMKFH